MRNIREAYVVVVVVALVLVCACPPWVSSDSRTCTPPPQAIPWDPNPVLTVHTVTWAYGDNVTCHTFETCNGTEPLTSDFTVTPEDETDVQLVPLEIQIGNILRFSPSHHMGIPFPIMPYKVDEAGFLSCNTSGGRPLLEAETNETFDVDPDFLQLGSNYFIGADTHPLVSCSFGLRLNVTVKSSLCHVTHGASCSGWGVCVTYRGQPSFQCHCCGNYKGDNCEIFDSCLSGPCNNGGACFHPTNDSHEYACKCSLGYYGEHCEKQAEDLCQLIDCHNNATCTGNSTSFHCACPPGLTGTHCEVDINECVTSPCEHGLCVDERNGYTCYCEPGYHGVTCSEHHLMCSLNPCKHGGFCQDTTSDDGHFSFLCHCRPGWSGKDCSIQVPVCDPNPCSSHGSCRETSDGFRCECAPGFAGSRCEVNINDCDPNPCRFGGHCRDGVNGHTCLCVHSHAGSNCQFTLDMFSPTLDEVDEEGRVVHDPEHTRNLYIVAGCLTALLLLMVAILLACYCRLGDLGRSCSCCGWNRFWYKKHSDELTVNVDVTRASDCPLAVDAFWPPLMREDSGATRSTSTTSFGNQIV